MERRAYVSKCGKYRYSLSRTWDESLPIVVYIGINPNTADANSDDPTIRRLIGFSKEFGYGGFIIMNLFPYRGPNPKELFNPKVPAKEFEDSIIQNDTLLDSISNYNSILEVNNITIKDVVFMWGNEGILNNKDQEIIKKFPKALCFGKSKKGNPKHPLFLKKGTKLVSYAER